MAKQPTPEEKAERLRQFDTAIGEFNRIDRYLKSQSPWLGPTGEKRDDEAQKDRARLRDQLLRESHEIGALIQAVNVDGFMEKSPQGSRTSVVRAIGVYERIIAGQLTLQELASERAAQQKVEQSRELGQRGSPLWLTIALAVLTVAGSSVGSYLGAFYGGRQTCIAGDQKACLERPGGFMECNPDGLGFGECLPTMPPEPPAPCPSPATTPTQLSSAP